jgi:hypothetical protein
LSSLKIRILYIEFDDKLYVLIYLFWFFTYCLIFSLVKKIHSHEEKEKEKEKGKGKETEWSLIGAKAWKALALSCPHEDKLKRFPCCVIPTWINRIDTKIIDVTLDWGIAFREK